MRKKIGGVSPGDESREQETKKKDDNQESNGKKGKRQKYSDEASRAHGGQGGENVYRRKEEVPRERELRKYRE